VLLWPGYAVLLGEADGLFVPRVRVTNHAQARVAGQHALQAPIGFLGAIGQHYHSGMLRITDADASAVVDGNPGGATLSVLELPNGPNLNLCHFRRWLLNWYAKVLDMQAA